ncbi:MAG TPA: hypothetical protein VGK67_17450 [Myxococcales bacterium]|jgi:hypothetical protein
MPKRSDRGSRAGRTAGDSRAPLGRVYEGEAVLQKLLSASGASVKVAEVVELFKSAQVGKVGPDEAFPDLFDDEPKFASTRDARRLYDNLFGLWDRVAAGGPIEPKGRPEARAREGAPAPEPMASPLSTEFVEAAWKHLVDLPPKDTERWLHKWVNTQPELTEALQLEVGDDLAVGDAADTVTFEVWAMMELAQKTRIRPVLMKEFRAQLDSRDAPEPALDQYIDDALEEAGLDEEQPLTDEQAAKVARVARAAARALAKAR